MSRATLMVLCASLAACGGPLGPPDASLRIRVDVDQLPDPPPDDPSDFALRFEGEVTALSFARQEFTLAGFDTPERALTVATDDGRILSLGLDARIDGELVGPAFDLDVGDRVSVTLAQVMPFWIESALLVDDADGLVVAGAEGSIVELDDLAERLEVSAGSRDPRTFNHPCGRGRALTLDVRADTEIEVPMNEAASTLVDGVAVEIANVGSWAAEERPGVSCADFAPPFRWAAWRQR